MGGSAVQCLFVDWLEGGGCLVPGRGSGRSVGRVEIPERPRSLGLRDGHVARPCDVRDGTGSSSQWLPENMLSRLPPSSAPMYGGGGGFLPGGNAGEWDGGGGREGPGRWRLPEMFGRNTMTSGVQQRFVR